MALESDLFHGDSKLEAAAVSDPAHIVPGDRGDHVRKIQTALIQVDGATIAVDGIYGPATAKAVLAYKTKRNIINRAYQIQPDNIVGKMTIAALDAELGGDGPDAVPPTSRSRFGECEVQFKKKKTGSGSDALAPDFAKEAFAVMLVPRVRVAISAARFHLDAASPFVTSHKLTRPTGPFQAMARRSIGLLINVFSMDKLKNPRPGFENILRVFLNMDVALNRSFETHPLIAPHLFVPNIRKSMEDGNFAYTSAGGAFIKSNKIKLRGLGVPANRIYICGDLLKESEAEQIDTLVHELAHYVSGQPLVVSHEHGVPKQGDMLKNRAPLDRIQPEAKLRSAEHYAFFAMAAGRSRLFPDD